MAETTTLFKSAVLLEDDPAHAHLIKRALKGLCEEVRHFEALAPALENCRERIPDLIITDLHLADSAEVTSIGSLKQVVLSGPVVVLTSSTSLHDAVEAMRIGADDFIVKDFGTDFREILGLSLKRVKLRYALEEEKLRLERQMMALRHAIENGNDGLAVATHEGRIAYCNSAFTQFVERCKGDGKQLQSIFGEGVASAQKAQQAVQEKLRSLHDGAVWHTEVSLVDTPGAAFDVSLSVMPRATEGSEDGARYVAWIRDVSEQKRREKFQREILSTTTHDLKGPLGAIIISAELLQGLAGENKKVADLSLRVNSSAQTAVNLIDEFLSARRIQEGNFILKPQMHDVVNIVRESVDGFSAVAGAKNISLTFESDTPRIDWSLDKLGFARALGNLLSNAIKFTPKKGAVTVQVQHSSDTLHVTVRDTGPGMEPAEVQKIFNRFSRLEKHREVPGTGLGLFVVKSVVGAHGGTVEVTSQPGVGTSFDMVFPVNPPINERGELICLDFA